MLLYCSLFLSHVAKHFKQYTSGLHDRRWNKRRDLQGAILFRVRIAPGLIPSWFFLRRKNRKKLRALDSLDSGCALKRKFTPETNVVARANAPAGPTIANRRVCTPWEAKKRKKGQKKLKDGDNARSSSTPTANVSGDRAGYLSRASLFVACPASTRSISWITNAAARCSVHLA